MDDKILQKNNRINSEESSCNSCVDQPFEWVDLGSRGGVGYFVDVALATLQSSYAVKLSELA